MKFISYSLLIPFWCALLITIFLIVINESINLYIIIPTLILLFINGYGLSKNIKSWNIISIISIIIFTTWYSIMRYYDYLKWTSIKIALFLLVFYITLYIIKIKTK